MRRVIIVQARTGSTRLPGKVLMPLRGRPMLAWQLERLQECHAVDEIVVATTREARDEPIVALAGKTGCAWHRGSERDVLGRYRAAAREAGADVVIRVTADCPLIDAGVTGLVADRLLEAADRFDYASNALERSYPRGLDTEVLFRDALERCARLATSAPAREHVTHFLLAERPELFLRLSVRDAEDHSDLRWTVDTPEDFEMVRRLFESDEIDAARASYAELLAHVRAHPEIAALNAGVAQKAPV